MTCKSCNVEMRSKQIEFEDEYRGESVTAVATGHVCPGCSTEWFGLDDVAEYGRYVADAYRRKHRLLTSNDIREARERLGMTQERFAEYLGVGVASVKRWEWGHAQDRAYDKLIRLLTDPAEAEATAHRVRELMACGPEASKVNELFVFLSSAAAEESWANLVLRLEELNASVCTQEESWHIPGGRIGCKKASAPFFAGLLT